MSVRENLIAAMCALGDATVRVERMFWIPSLASGEAPAPDFKEFCEDLPEERDHPLYRAIPALLNSLDENEFDPEFVAEDLRQSGVGGFLVQAATPFFEYRKDGRSHSYTWGHYYTAWMYAPDEASLPAVLSEWANGSHALDRDRAIAAQPEGEAP